jgi:hypothetical protein
VTREARILTAVAAAASVAAWVVPPAAGWATWGDALNVAAALAALVAWTAGAVWAGVWMAARGEAARLDVALALRKAGEQARWNRAVALAKADMLRRLEADTDVALDIIQEDT